MLLITRLEVDDDVGHLGVFVSVPPERGAVEFVDNLLVVVNVNLGLLHVALKLGLELALPTMLTAQVGEVGLDRNEEVAALETLGAILWDGYLYVWVEEGADLVDAHFDPGLVQCHGVPRANKTPRTDPIPAHMSLVSMAYWLPWVG